MVIVRLSVPTWNDPPFSSENDQLFHDLLGERGWQNYLIAADWLEEQGYPLSAAWCRLVAWGRAHGSKFSSNHFEARKGSWRISTTSGYDGLCILRCTLPENPFCLWRGLWPGNKWHLVEKGANWQKLWSTLPYVSPCRYLPKVLREGLVPTFQNRLRLRLRQRPFPTV